MKPLRNMISVISRSIWWNRLRLVYWPRYVAWPIDRWRFSRMMKLVAREAEWRRRQAWQFLQRSDLNPEEEELAQRYYKAMRDYFQVCQDIKREVFGSKK